MSFENLLNTALILENKQVTCGLMTCLWSKRKRSTKESSWIREQYPMYLMMILTMCAPQTDTEISYQQITSGGISWPPTGEFTFTGTQQTLSNTPHTTDYAFYCKSQNTTHSASEDPPDHTISIEANIRASGKEKSVSLDNFWRHRILTSCGEDRVSRWDKHVDPALCMYYGVKFICVMDNTALCQRVPRENGTMCRFRSIKLKPGASSVRTKFFHGRKVTTVNAKDVQYMECEVIDNSSHIKQLARRIKELSLKPRPDTKKSKTPLTD
jgi:hypothetical protein